VISWPVSRFDPVPVEAFAGLLATGLFRGAVNLGAPMDEPVGCSLVLGCVPFGPLARHAEINNVAHA
jgi:hypothetical protein